MKKWTINLGNLPSDLIHRIVLQIEEAKKRKEEKAG